MSKRPIGLIAAVLALGLITGGCGGDSSTASITKAVFIKKADAACEKGNRRLQADFATYLKSGKAAKASEPTEADYSELVATVVAPNLEQEIEEIRALGAPSGDEEQVEAILEAREESIEKAEANPELMSGNGDELFTKPRKLAREYGLKVCGAVA